MIDYILIGVGCLGIGIYAGVSISLYTLRKKGKLIEKD